MDPHKQKQMVSQLFENTAKSQEELDKMTADDRREYLRGRLKQKMFFSGVSRQSTQQKKKMQENMEQATKKTEEETELGETVSKSSEKNKKKKDRKRAAKAAQKAAEKALEDNSIDDDIVIVKRESESDYESD
jgi:RNase P protein component